MRPYHLPGEDDGVRVLTVTKGDLEVVHNALCLYCYWLKQRGTLPVEYGDTSPEQDLLLEKLKELNISPEQLAIELKGGALGHAVHLRDYVEEEIEV